MRGASRLSADMALGRNSVLDLATRFRRIDNDPLANDAAVDQPEFEFVVCARALAGCNRQQLGLTLNFERYFPTPVKIGTPHLDHGLVPAPSNEFFYFAWPSRLRFRRFGLFGRIRASLELIRRAVAVRPSSRGFCN